MLPEQFEYHGPPKRCPYCGSEFMPITVRQIYCTAQCNERAKYERKVKLRKKHGFCPQCGKEMIPAEITKTGRKAGRKPSYCLNCQKYFQRRRSICRK